MSLPALSGAVRPAGSERPNAGSKEFLPALGLAEESMQTELQMRGISPERMLTNVFG